MGRRKLKDFPKCGQRVEYLRSIHGDDYDNNDECTWRCKWVQWDRPLVQHEKNISYTTYEYDYEGNKICKMVTHRTVTFVQNLRAFPDDLSCLAREPCRYSLSLASSQCKDARHNSTYQNFYDCYLDQRRINEIKSLDKIVPQYYISRNYVDILFEICYLIELNVPGLKRK